MVICHSMNAGSVSGRDNETQTYVKEFLHSQAVGIQKLAARALATKLPGETFTITPLNELLCLPICR